MRFAHLADCHIGSWRDPKLREVSTKAFIKAIDLALEKNIDFIIIAGDLFNTSLPAVERLKDTVEKLKELKDKGIPVYVIAGSHDFSPSGKTMLDVLEKAGLFINVLKGAEVIDERLKLNFTVDRKTGAKITGMVGLKGGLEKEHYKSLIKENLENEPGYKIFMFHSALTELKPESMKDVPSHPLSFLPMKFNYYAGGHPHYVFQKQEENYGLIAYPGPLFPNNFKEIEDLEIGGFYMVYVEEIDGDYITKAEWEPIQIHNVEKITIDAENKTPEQVQEDVSAAIKTKEFTNTIVSLRIEGTLASGKPSDIDINNILKKIYEKSAYFVMKNTSKLFSKEFEEIKADAKTVDNVEADIIKEHLQQIKVVGVSAEKEESMIRALMQVLASEREEGETATTFETRLRDESKRVLDL